MRSKHTLGYSYIILLTELLNPVISTCSTGEHVSDVQANDCQILRSILNDGHYDIASEDRAALETVIAMPLCAMSEEEAKHEQ